MRGEAHRSMGSRGRHQTMGYVAERVVVTEVVRPLRSVRSKRVESRASGVASAIASRPAASRSVGNTWRGGWGRWSAPRRSGLPGGRGNASKTFPAAVALLCLFFVAVSPVGALALDSSLSEGPRSFHERSGPIPLIAAGGPTPPGVRPAALPAGAAPVGLSDVGTGGEASYTTGAVRGTADLVHLATYNATLGSASHQLSVQLNAFLTFRVNSTTYDYWTQDVLEVDSSTHAAYFEDNLWNATSPVSSALDPATIRGNGSVTNSSDGQYYAAVASPSLPGASTTLVLPTNVAVQMNASVNATGRPQLRFLFSDGHGLTVFDTVTFRFANVSAGTALFSVNGSAQTLACQRCVNNLEFVLGGPFGGAQTAVVGPTNVLLSLDRWGGHNFLSVPDADNYGVATAESLSGAAAVLHATSGKGPGVAIATGSFAPGPLWRASNLTSVFVSVGTTPVSGSLTVNGSMTPFVNGSVGVLLLPGTVTLLIRVGVGTYGLANLTLNPGDLDTFEVGGIAVVFVPQGLANGTAWQVTLANETLRGTGEITFGVGNGTFGFTIGPLSGYTASPSSGFLRVNGSGYDQVIVWNSNAPSLQEQIVSLLELDLGPVPLYAILGFIVFVGVVAAVLDRKGRGRRRRSRPNKDPDTWFDDE